MKKDGWAAGLAVLLLLAGGAPADAKNVKDFPCQIDLSERVGQTADGAYEIDPNGSIVPENLRTTFGSYRQQRVCQGKKDVKLSCSALIDGWPFKANLFASDFTCLIKAAECGITDPNAVDGVSVAKSASLRIVATQSSLCGKGDKPRSCGLATLDCQLQK
jgi:hypothetical protein